MIRKIRLTPEFSGPSLQLTGGLAFGPKGFAGSGTLGLGKGWGSGGLTAGPAIGLGAGIAGMFCWTFGIEEVPCVGPNPL